MSEYPDIAHVVSFVRLFRSFLLVCLFSFLLLVVLFYVCLFFVLFVAGLYPENCLNGGISKCDVRV